MSQVWAFGVSLDFYVLDHDQLHDADSVIECVVNSSDV